MRKAEREKNEAEWEKWKLENHLQENLFEKGMRRNKTCVGYGQFNDITTNRRYRFSSTNRLHRVQNSANSKDCYSRSQTNLGFYDLYDTY